MSKLARTLTLGALALGLGTTALAAQQKPRGPANYRWYVGAQGGVTNFETTGQTRGWLPVVGGHTLIIARRTGLLLSIDETLGSDEVGFFNDALSPTGSREVRFNSIRRYQGVLMAFPWRQPIEPYFGVGGGIAHAVNPQPLNTAGLTPDEIEFVLDQTKDATSYAYLSALAGVQLRGGPFVLFGQVQIMSSPGRGTIYVGPSYLGTAGLRISLGSSRDNFAQ
jgi:hypothetical protein